MATLSIIIPAYNEEKAIGEIIGRILKEKENISKSSTIIDVELIIVDDGSKDKTAEIAKQYSEVKVVTHKTNQGYGAALKSGFNVARGELLAFLDADGTYPPESLVCLCQAIIEKNADIVIGSRLSGGEKSKMPKIRYIGNRIFAFLLSWVADKKVIDSASGIRILKREILSKLYPLPDGLDFTPAMSTRAIYENLKILEIPIAYEERVGQSKLNPVKDGIRFLRSIIYFAKQYNPLKFFGSLGIICILFGFFLSIRPVTFYLFNRLVPEPYIYRLLFVLIMFVAGVNMVSFGIMANFILSIIHRQPLRPLWLSRLIYEKRLYGKFALIGFLLGLSGILINIPSMAEYFTTGNITVHWSYFVTGAVLILVGLQLFSLGVLLKIVEDLSLRGIRAKEDMER